MKFNFNFDSTGNMMPLILKYGGITLISIIAAITGVSLSDFQ
jgi:hypothetical protein